MIRAVEGLSQNAPMKVPTGASGEIAMLSKPFACRDAEMREEGAGAERRSRYLSFFRLLSSVTSSGNG
jgi:hypothetical protein